MSVTIELDLPTALLTDAKAKGLLEPDALTEMIEAELKRRRKQAGRELVEVLKRIRSVPGEPMTAEEISAEIKAAHRARR